MLQETEENLVFVKKYYENSKKYWSIWEIWPLIEDSDPLGGQWKNSN
jgi:hypothetical protein